MTLPRALVLLVPALVIAGLVVFFAGSGPAPRPEESEHDGHTVDAPVALPGEGSPAPRPAEPASARPDAPAPAMAVTVPRPMAPPTPRGPRPLRVVDDGGAPIPGAEVAVLDDLPDVRAGVRRGGVGPFRTLGVTELDGSCVVPADVPRAGAVRVRAAGFGERAIALEPFPSVIRLARARSLQVYVIDDRARPIAGATVRAVGPLRDVEVLTGPNGRAELAADGTEWRRLEVFADGFVVATRDATLTGLPRDPAITVVLDSARPILGRVVADEDSRPLEGATVLLVSAAVEGGTLATTTSGADGSFTLRTEMSPGFASTVHVSAPGRLPAILSASSDLPAYLEPTKRPDASSTERPPPRSMEVRLERGRAIDGIVKDRAGAPVGGARVRAVPASVRAAGPPQDGDRAHSTTDAQGRFQVRVPKVGSDADWHVVARGPQGDWGSFPIARMNASDAPLVIVLEGLGSIEGRVVTPDGVGVAGVRVRPTAAAALSWLVGSEDAVEGNGGASPSAASTDSTLTAPDGTFRLGPLPAGDVELSIERDGQSVGRSVSTLVTSGKTTALDAILLDVAEISGSVVDVSGHAAAGVFVRLERVPSEAAARMASVVRDTRTDETGRFRFASMNPEEAVSLMAVSLSGEFAHLQRVLPRAEPFELRLVPQPRLVLKVTRGGQPYEGPLRVSFRGSPPPGPSGREDLSFLFNEGVWVTCIAGYVSMPLMTVASYAVEAASAEAEPASASGTSEIDPTDPKSCRVTLDLRVQAPAAPDTGMPAGR